MKKSTRQVGETVAVVVPTFNRADLVVRALSSVARQTRLPDEVVLVDDGSTDKTAEQVEGRFPEVRVLRQANRGVSAARNLGIRSTSAEWLAFLDSDDEWLPEKLERQLSALESQPDHRICHTDEIWIRNGNRVLQRRVHQKHGGWIFRHCLPLCAISPSSVLVRRDLLEEVGLFDEQLAVCEDYDLWLRICCRFPVLLVNECLVVKYGGHADQLSRREVGMDRFRIRALESILKSDLLSQEDSNAVRVELDRKIKIYADGAEKRGRNDEARRYRQRSSKSVGRPTSGR